MAALCFLLTAGCTDGIPGPFSSSGSVHETVDEWTTALETKSTMPFGHILAPYILIEDESGGEWVSWAAYVEARIAAWQGRTYSVVEVTERSVVSDGDSARVRGVLREEFREGFSDAVHTRVERVDVNLVRIDGRWRINGIRFGGW